jgi:hypothetical protein
MKLSTIVNKKIVWIVFIVIIGIILIHTFNVYEGIFYVDGKYNTNTQKVVIRPISGDDYLHLSQLKLYGDSGIIDYNAESSNGIYDDNNNYDYDKLTDSDNKTFFHSKKHNATLTVTPKKNSSKITKIVIGNRLDCCLDRLRGYELSIIRNDGSVFFSKNLDQLNNLYTRPYMEELLIS